MFVEINLIVEINCSYNPNKAPIANHIAVLSKNIDIYATNYSNLLFLGVKSLLLINTGLEDASIKHFRSAYIVSQV